MTLEELDRTPRIHCGGTQFNFEEAPADLVDLDYLLDPPRVEPFDGDDERRGHHNYEVFTVEDEREVSLGQTA